MCGIIAYSGNDNAEKIILDGLQALEYRGYDSAGMSVFADKKMITIKTQGRVQKLKEKTSDITSETNCGIGHTRWATHGRPSETNAHPHTTGLISVVHNGIIENYALLKENLIKKGYTFNSETDTEVAAMLIHHEYKKSADPLKAITDSVQRLRGSYALCIIFKDIHDCVYAVRKDSPLILGKNDNGNFIASDISAFPATTDTFYRINDGAIAEITKNGINLFDDNGKKHDISWEKYTQPDITESNDKNDNFRHFMYKEITEEPAALRKTFLSLTKDGLPYFNEKIPDDFFEKIKRFHITACGTAYHAGLTGKYFFEKIAKIPADAETAGEFRYNDPLTGKDEAVIIISQSGETADSLAALRLMKKRKIPVISVVNSIGSSIEAESDYVIRTLAGREVSVASTKAFSVQILALFLFACELALKNNVLSETECVRLFQQAENIFTNKIQEILSDDSSVRNAAKVLAESKNAFFIGRGCDSVLSLEASLKLKEITYINSSAYPAAELKHGTISLIEKNTPVVVIATNEDFYDKIRSNIEEVRSRGAFIISVCPSDADSIKEVSDITIPLPVTDKLLCPFLTATAVQLLAYHTADILGRDIDKPRNLAKSVTVE